MIACHHDGGRGQRGDECARRGELSRSGTLGQVAADGDRVRANGVEVLQQAFGHDRVFAAEVEVREMG